MLLTLVSSKVFLVLCTWVRTLGNMAFEWARVGFDVGPKEHD